MTNRSELITITKHPTLGELGVFVLKSSKSTEQNLFSLASKLVEHQVALQHNEDVHVSDNTLFKLVQIKRNKQIRALLNTRDYGYSELKRLVRALDSLSHANIFPRTIGGRPQMHMLLFLGDEIIDKIKPFADANKKPGFIVKELGLGMAKTGVRFFLDFRYESDTAV